MTWIAWRMLIGNRGKYIGIIVGIAFSALLIAQQSSVFCGLMRLTYSQIRDIQGADIWVMDPNVQFVDDIKPLRDEDLGRVQGVTGVDWAQRLYKGLGRAKLADGMYRQIIVLGLDNSSLVGAPVEMLLGNIADLSLPDSILMDDAGFNRMWPGEEFSLGKTFEMNDHRAIIVGICRTSRTFQTFPVVYTRYSQAVNYSPTERKFLSFILAQPQAGYTSQDVCKAITAQPGLKAMTRDEFMDVTEKYFLRETGIPLNFGIVVVLGFIVGATIAGQTFYMFTIENMKQFGALKAMGTGNGRIVLMVLLQAFQVGAIGYGIGVGLAAICGKVMVGASSRLAFFMPWQVLVITAILVVIIILIASVLSIRKVLVIDPAIVFQS